MAGLTWLLTVLSLLGVILNIKKKRICFVIWAFTNLVWAIVDFMEGIPAQGILFIGYFLLSLWGIYEWRKGKI